MLFIRCQRKDAPMLSVEQLEFRPRLPVVVGNTEYRQYEERLLRMDELLRQSGLVAACEERCTVQWLQQLKTQAARAGKCFHEPSAKQLTRYQRLCRQALRCNLARQWIGKEYRQTGYPLHSRRFLALSMISLYDLALCTTNCSTSRWKIFPT